MLAIQARMPSMNPNWSQELFVHARAMALEAHLSGADVVTDDGHLAAVIEGWQPPGAVLPEDVRMIAVLALLGPVVDVGPPQLLRDWLLDDRVCVPHPDPH